MHVIVIMWSEPCWVWRVICSSSVEMLINHISWHFCKCAYLCVLHSPAYTISSPHYWLVSPTWMILQLPFSARPVTACWLAVERWAETDLPIWFRPGQFRNSLWLWSKQLGQSWPEWHFSLGCPWIFGTTESRKKDIKSFIYVLLCSKTVSHQRNRVIDPDWPKVESAWPAPSLLSSPACACVWRAWSRCWIGPACWALASDVEEGMCVEDTSWQEGLLTRVRPVKVEFLKGFSETEDLFFSSCCEESYG